MSTIQFTVNLGAGSINVLAGIAFFFGLKNGSPYELDSMSVDSDSFIRDLDTSAYTYLYVVLYITKYDAGDGPTSLGDRAPLLLSVFRNSDTTISIGERETIAATYCFARFFEDQTNTPVSIAASDRDMAIMYGMRNNFISSDGELSTVISTSPNGLETNSYPMFNFLSTLLSYCITDQSIYDSFVQLSPSTMSSVNSFQSFLSMVLNPWNQVQAIYDLISTKPRIYTPTLPDMYDDKQRKKWSSVPNQWTLTIKRNDSGAQNFIIAGPGYIAFDKNDRAWVSTNVTAGTPNSSDFCVAFNSDGSPADFSPVYGGGLLGGGFGVTANPDGSQILFGNYGWGPKQYNPQTGSISVISADGEAVSPKNGFTKELSRVQGLEYDNDGNLWMASWGTQSPMAPVPGTVYNFPNQPSAIVVYLNFDGVTPPGDDDVLYYQFENPGPYNCTFDMAFDNQGNAFVTNAGGSYTDDEGIKQYVPSSLYKMRIARDMGNRPYLEVINSYTADDYCVYRQVNVNEQGEVFVASVGDGGILRFDNALENTPELINTNIGKPWGVSFGRDGLMYVANFFALHEQEPAEGEADVRGTFGVTVVPPDNPTAAQIMTLPTGGSPVTLANTYGIYGTDGPPCYQPLSRLTGTGIDRVGNLWALNNWKPSAYIDFSINPGGDGVVIFIGAAAPDPQGY